jgi:hypothetical protein
VFEIYKKIDTQMPAMKEKKEERNEKKIAYAL